MRTNICFHGVGVCHAEREPGEARYWIAKDEFHRILDVVAGRPHVRISFDDGNRSDAETALPALIERGLSADVFALAGRLDDPASLDASDLRGLHAAGMRIGSHGWGHVPWQRLDASAVRREFHDARTRLTEAVGAHVDAAAMPLGRYDRRALSGLRAAGYRTVFSSDRFPAREASWLQARYSVTASDTAASIRRLLDHPYGLHEARNLAASMIKRMR